ncbi:uncharacterized protein BP5553_00719 [Venustampulla echinocandica]|uniref:Cytochrome b561 domain-containing protein n=1 Tax=Venustampulla echinocandica TaxID=2656787 RepID=A0A370TYZ5_9HELO|nr:uncharacterized protein BP5553_00719 [Venustampulla echinocandica]RDL40740.1 hypothetical protein BP5553_00719 [Venustampulla echinocandica]
MPGYHTLIKGHAVLAVITFLFIVPAAIFTARFYGRSPRWALRFHIYLQVLTVGLSTVIFTLGWFAVGQNRSLTNPHHGIGLAIYVLILVQAIGGGCIHRREKKRARRKVPIILVLHQWVGRAIALLAIAQVPLGLTLYGSPKWTFILYTLWMVFLVVLWFVLSYKAMVPFDGMMESSHGGTVIEDRKSSRFGGLLPLAAGAGAAALLAGRHRDRSRSRSRSRRDEVVPSRRGSGSYIEDEKYNNHRRKESGGMMDTVLKGAAVLGVGALAKSWFDKRKDRKHEDEYSSVAPDTPSRRHRRHDESVISDDTRLEEGRRPRTPTLPGPGGPLAGASAMSAGGPGPVTPGRAHRHSRSSSYSSSYDSTQLSPSRRPQSQHGVAKGVMAGLGLGWIAKKMNDRKHKKEQDRLDRLEDERIEEERRARHGAAPGGPRFTGDGFPTGRRHGRRGEHTESSDLSSILDDPHTIRPGSSIPPVPPAFAAGGAAGATIPPSGSRHDITDSVAMPPHPPDPQGILHQSESGTESFLSQGGHPHRRPSQSRRRAGEAAAAEAAAAAAGLAAEEEARRQRSRSRARSSAAADPVSLKLKVHNDKDRNVTLRRLTEQEAAAEREARKAQKERRRRADSLSSLSGSEVPAPRPRYRRSEREAERRAEAGASTDAPPPPMAPLSPPHPAFAGGRKPKDSAYYSGRPGDSSALGAGTGSIGSPESHGTWSGMSPGSVSEDPAERRRRRRLERNRQGSGPPTTMDFT